MRPKSNRCSNQWMESFPFPDDLLRAQQAWHAAYRELAAPRPRHTTVLRRRLLKLSVRIQWHPFWATLPAAFPRPGWSSGASPARSGVG